MENAKAELAKGFATAEMLAHLIMIQPGREERLEVLAPREEERVKEKVRANLLPGPRVRRGKERELRALEGSHHLVRVTDPFAGIT